MIDDPLVICPECGGHIRRLFFPAGIVFKGSGFYKTDHRSSQATADANANGHSTKGEEATTSAASNESKAASDGKSTATETSSGSKGTSTGENKAPAATTTATK